MSVSEWPLLAVRWTDSCGSSGWQSPDGFEHWRPSACVSIGYLMRETDEAILLAPHVSGIDNNQRDLKVDGVFCIPKFAIIGRHEIQGYGAMKDWPASEALVAAADEEAA